MRILITGANGLTGQKIVGQLNKSNIEYRATSMGPNRNSACPGDRYASLDITDPIELKEVIADFQPDAIINTAAMTNVDACEDDIDTCNKINVQAVEYLLNCCKVRDIHLIHISTDFVFDGTGGPYREDDERKPLSVYAKSKYDSENLLLESNYKNWTILRTIIVFGECENMSRSNIVLWAIDALKEKKELTIVNDQFRAPTWADDLAWACIQAAKLNARGVFHISGPETFSIYELVCRVADFIGADRSLIKPISTSQLNQKAKRPPKTGFILDKARKILNYNPMSFEQSLLLLSQGR